MRRSPVLLLAAALLASVLVGAPPAVAKPVATPTAPVGTAVFTGEVTGAQLRELRDLGVDQDSVSVGRGSTTAVSRVEVVLTPPQAARLVAQGVPLAPKLVRGAPAAQRTASQQAAGYTVFRSYSEPGGIADELKAVARQYPRLTKLVSLGKTVQGQDILALKVTRDAVHEHDGSRPAVLYVAAQHAREWITPEVDRRLLHYYLEHDATDATVRHVLDTTELWFVPVANPDGYDYTFAGQRLWRKNLRDVDGDGVIGYSDGVDLNRNFADHWGYDNEGSSPDPSSEIYRGSAPSSEPETRALAGLLDRIRFRFLVNYHSASEQLDYGVGWQVATPSPDDLIYQAMAGDTEHPAVPGSRPALSSAEYILNGETDAYAEHDGTLSFTPEMSSCQTAAASDPDDAFAPEDCPSTFEFPDSEALVQAEFARNLPFALAVARSARHPDRPVSVVGRSTPDFALHPFTVSYGSPQPVAVTARRSLRHLRLHYAINGHRPVRTTVREWTGGERYGGEDDVYYAEFRGKVRGAKPGDQVRVWFTGRRPGGAKRASSSFTYRLAEDTGHPVLVLANEDYEGVNPTYPASVTGPKYAADYVRALQAKGYQASVWDVSRQGVPDPLGVLGHFRAVVWYLGDNRLTQDPDDLLTEINGRAVPDASVAARQQYLTMAVRDYLNGGGKLVHTGETAGYFGTYGAVLGGIYYGSSTDPTKPCVVTGDLFGDCLLLADDFYQYYLGAYSRSTLPQPTAFRGLGVLSPSGGAFGGQATVDNPLNEPGTFAVTSDRLPVEQFPQFASRSAGTYRAPSVVDPVDGSWYVVADRVDNSYQRVARTIDLTGVTAAQAPALQAELRFDTGGFGGAAALLEAHPVGSADWTTLPEAGGLTSTATPVCSYGELTGSHPFLYHYLTVRGDDCVGTGTTGTWNALQGSSDGWRKATFDLSAYAGQRVEVVLSYVTDPSATPLQGVGVYLDDATVVVTGAVRARDGFETGLGGWRTLPTPPGSPPTGARFHRAESSVSSAVSTQDSVLLGFGVEQLASPADRARVLGRALRHLLPPRT